MGQGRDHILRNPWNPPDAPVPFEHWRHYGYVLQVPLLESLLLRLHEEAQEETVQGEQKHDQIAGVSP